MKALLVLLMIYAAFLFASWSEAAVIWSSGFETSPDDDWHDTYVQGTGCLVDYRAEAAHTGSMGSYHYVPSTSEDGSIARGRAFEGSTYSERHARFSVNLDGFFLPETYPMRAITPIMRDVGSYVEVLYRRDGSDYQLRLRIKTLPVGYIESDPVVIDKTQWHQVDLYIKDESAPGAGDGIVRWWVDGVEEYTRTDMGALTPTDSWVFGIAGPAGGPLDEYGYLYMDDVTVWDALTVPGEYMLSVSSTAGGSVTDPGEGAYNYAQGSVVPIVASAEENHHFVGWTGTGVVAGKVDNPALETTTITMDGSYAVEAVFAIDQHTLTVSSSTGGSVTNPGEGAFDYDHGTAVPITAEEETGYYFSGWTGTAVDAGKVTDPGVATTDVTVEADYEVVANFTLIDSDGDGLVDTWEQQIVDADPEDDISTIEDVLPGDDFDGDGNTNETEETAGTDPTDPGSFFAIIQMDKIHLPLEVTVTWTSVTGKFYAVYYSDDDPGVGAVWTLAEDMIPASGSGTNDWTDDGTLTSPVPDDAGLMHRNYRVLVYPD